MKNERHIAAAFLRHRAAAAVGARTHAADIWLTHTNVRVRLTLACSRSFFVCKLVALTKVYYRISAFSISLLHSRASSTEFFSNCRSHCKPSRLHSGARVSLDSPSTANRALEALAGRHHRRLRADNSTCRRRRRKLVSRLEHAAAAAAVAVRNLARARSPPLFPPLSWNFWCRCRRRRVSSSAVARRCAFVLSLSVAVWPPPPPPVFFSSRFFRI